MIASKGNYQRFLDVMQTAWGHARKVSSVASDQNGIIPSGIVELGEESDNPEANDGPSSPSKPDTIPPDMAALQARLVQLEATNRNLAASREEARQQAAMEQLKQQEALAKLQESEKTRQSERSELQKQAHELADQAAVSYLMEHFLPQLDISSSSDLKGPARKPRRAHPQTARTPRPKRSLPLPLPRVEALLEEFLQRQTPPPDLPSTSQTLTPSTQYTSTTQEDTEDEPARPTNSRLPGPSVDTSQRTPIPSAPTSGNVVQYSTPSLQAVTPALQPSASLTSTVSTADAVHPAIIPSKDPSENRPKVHPPSPPTSTPSQVSNSSKSQGPATDPSQPLATPALLQLESVSLNSTSSPVTTARTALIGQPAPPRTGLALGVRPPSLTTILTTRPSDATSDGSGSLEAVDSGNEIQAVYCTPSTSH